jgi:hypothetical protein
MRSVSVKEEMSRINSMQSRKTEILLVLKETKGMGNLTVQKGGNPDESV